MSNIEVVKDVRKFKLVGALPIHGNGRKLANHEQLFISALVDPSRPGNVAQLALDHGILTGPPVTITVRFADGKEAGVRLVPQ